MVGQIITRRDGLRAFAGFAALPLAGCGTWISRNDIKDGAMSGRVFVEWYCEDKFVYRKQGSNPFSFKPSFMKTAIVPEDMFTDGGSVPRVFWNIPGLSPWALGPAYIIHDWIFEVHRCKRPAPPEIAAITFEQSALILAEVGKALIDHGMVRDDLLDEIVWAVGTRFARNLWDAPGDTLACMRPPPVSSTFDTCPAAPKPPTTKTQKFFALRAPPRRKVIDFVIPPKRR